MKILTLALILLAAAPLHASDSVIESLEHEFNAALLARDAATLDRLLDDAYEDGRDRTFSKPEVLKEIEANIPPKTSTIDELSVRVSGDTAYATGLTTMSWLSPAGAETRIVRWVHVWEHGEDGWRVVYGQSTTVGYGEDGGC